MVAYSFKKQFVAPIKAGLGLPFDAEVNHRINAKRQTIRAIGKRRHARPGETLQLYTAMRTKQCQKIGEARCIEVLPIRLFVALDNITIPDPKRGSNFFLSHDRREEFARADGFAGAQEMHEFWVKEHGHGQFNGLLIRWEALQ